MSYLRPAPGSEAVDRSLAALRESGARPAAALFAYRNATGGEAAKLDHVAAAVQHHLGDPVTEWRSWIEPTTEAVRILDREEL